MTIRPAPRALLRGVLFDLFGTLIRPERVQLSDVAPDTSDTFEDLNTDFLLRWAEGRGLPAPAQGAVVIRDARRWMWAQTYATGRQYLTREALARAAPLLGWPGDAPFLEEASLAFFTAEVDRVTPYADAAGALSALRTWGLRLAVVSNASEHHLIARVLERTGLDGYFDPVVSSADYGRVKPDPGIFRFVLDRWETAPEQCVMVGDTLDADVGGGQALGMRAILVTMDPNPTNPQVADRIRPDATAASLSEAMGIISRWLGRPA